MDKIVRILEEIELPFAYDHFAEGESPEPPFICYLTIIELTSPSVRFYLINLLIALNINIS